MILKSWDNKKITIHEWLNVKKPKGIVQIIHGMVEHGARYDRFAKFLNSKGYLVVADDHRGHGNTDKTTLGYCDGDMFADTVKDEGFITDYYKQKYPNLKYFVFGFSYGSFLTQSYIGKYGEKIDGVVIGGSNYKKDFQVYLGSFVCLFNNKKKPAKLIEKLSFGAYAKNFDEGEWLSVDKDNNTRYHADPYCKFTCSYRFYADFFRGLRKLYTRKYKKSLNKDLPILLISGKDDPVGNMGKGVKKLFNFYKNKAKVKHVSLILFPHSRHEFLNEMPKALERYQILLDFFMSI